MPQQHAFLRRTIEDSVDRYRELLLESIDPIAEDLATTIQEASEADKKATFRISHGLTIDLEKAISSDKIHWSITRSNQSSGPTPTGEDLEDQSKKDDAIWKKKGNEPNPEDLED